MQLSHMSQCVQQARESSRLAEKNYNGIYAPLTANETEHQVLRQHFHEMSCSISRQDRHLEQLAVNCSEYEA